MIRVFAIISVLSICEAKKKRSKRSDISRDWSSDYPTECHPRPCDDWDDLPFECHEKEGGKIVVDSKLAIQQIEAVMGSIIAQSAAITGQAGAEIQNNLVVLANQIATSVAFQVGIVNKSLEKQVEALLGAAPAGGVDITQIITTATNNLNTLQADIMTTLQTDIDAVIAAAGALPAADLSTYVLDVAAGLTADIAALVTAASASLATAVTDVHTQLQADIEAALTPATPAPNPADEVLAIIAAAADQVSTVFNNELANLVQGLASFVEMSIHRMNLNLELLYCEKGKIITEIVRSIGTSTDGCIPAPVPFTCTPQKTSVCGMNQQCLMPNPPIVC